MGMVGGGLYERVAYAVKSSRKYYFLQTFLGRIPVLFHLYI
jgi:hypothetical protein